ncbi:hypothetical protein YC2023_092361 [Brassica napus]
MKFWKLKEDMILAASYSEEMKIWHRFMNPYPQSDSMDLPVASDHCYMFSMTTDHNYAYTSTQ